MKLYINVKNVQVAKNLKKYLTADINLLEEKFRNMFPGELKNDINPQYETFINSIKQIKKEFGSDEKLLRNIAGFYIGNEQCEYLMPTKNEMNEMIDILQKDFGKNKQFVLLTPYFGNKLIEKRLIELLDEFSNRKDLGFNKEVVVNSVGTIQLIKEKGFKNLTAIWGTLLTKHFKAPVFENYESNALLIPSELLKDKTEEEKKEIYNNILENNKKEFDRAVWHNEYFVKLLKKFKINRASQYYLNYTLGIFKDVKNINLDIYFPYVLTTTGRLCHISHLENYRRGYYATDEVCPRTCYKYAGKINNVDEHKYKLYQHGNSIYKIDNNLKIELPGKLKVSPLNRLIYVPFL